MCQSWLSHAHCIREQLHSGMAQSQTLTFSIECFEIGRGTEHKISTEH